MQKQFHRKGAKNAKKQYLCNKTTPFPGSVDPFGIEMQFFKSFITLRSLRLCGFY
jgi:hypothetical protein